jgi:PAS domain S-box-containing protein
MLIETFPQWVWMTTPEGKVTFCNLYWREYSGLTLEQTARDEWVSLIHPDDKEMVLRVRNDALSTEQGYECEFRYRRARDGKYRWHRLQGIPVKNPAGRVTKWIVLGIDIHDSKAAQHELADREARLRAILETGPECIKLLSADGVLLEMNPAGLAMIEADSPKDVVGKPLIQRIVDPPYHQAFLDLYRRVFQGEEGNLDYEITGFKGTHRWLQTHAAPLRGEDGKIRAALAITRDITQQKKAENELRASESRFRALIEHSREGVALCDVLGKVVFCSGSIEGILGQESPQVVGRDLMELIHAEDRPLVQAAFQRALENPAEAITATPARMIHKDGSARTIQATLTNLLHNASVGAVVANFRDITANLQAEEALRRSEETFAKVFRSSPLSTVITSLSTGRYIDVNQAALDLSGYTRDEVIGRTAEEIKIYADPADRALFLQKLRQTGRVQSFQTNLRKRDGEIREVEISAEFIELNGSPGFMSISRDVTQAKRLEAQLRQAQKMEAVGRLAGGVAHDFNNMLAVIVGYCQLLQDRIEQVDPAQKFVQEIRKACSRAAGLTRQLLAFSRKQVLQPRVLNLNAVVNNLSRMLLRMIGEDISLVMAPATPLGSVRADLGQMEQILMNLVVNARDAMPQGGIIVIETANVDLKEDHAEHRPTVVPGPYVMLSVRDRGCGMDERTKSQIFEPFFTTKGPGKGTGLGLSMVYGAVKQSNGYIWVDTEPEKGTTFKLYFPRVEAEADPLVVETAQRAVAGGSETILVVEDEPSLRELIVDLLTQSGYRVMEARSVEEAMELAHKTQSLHLLLADVIMPTMSGHDLAEHLLSIKPGLKVLYMSGYSADRVLSHGVQDTETLLIGKPFTTQALLAKVRHLLDA